MTKRASVVVALMIGALGCKDKPTGGANEAKSTEKTSSKSDEDNASLAYGDDGDGEKNRFDVAVDGRAELLAIVFRLARSPGYTEAKGAYAADVDQSFAALANHAAVGSARGLTKSKGISFNAPIDFAVHLDKNLHPLLPFDPFPADLDARWKGVDDDEFVTELNDFAKSGHFKEFLDLHGPMYRATEEKFRAFVEKKPVVGWYEHAFGAREGASYHIAPCQLIGPNNFGVRAKDGSGNEALNVVMGFTTDDDEKPNFTLGDVAFELIAHETGHSFVNPIVDDAFDTLEKPASAVFALQKAAMQKLAYITPNIMTRESVNRAVVLLFLSDRSTAAHRDKTMQEEIERGFVWMPKLAHALAAVRKKNKGKLPADDVVEATRAVFQKWADDHAQ